MRRPIRPRWLLRLARELGGEGAGQGQPRNTDLRRSASTSYYAVFHAISLAVAQEALPNASDAERNGYARYVTHAAIKQVCAWVAGQNPPQHLNATVARLRANAPLSNVASTFIDLVEARERADYDHDADITRPATLALGRRATSAVAALDALGANNDFRAFFGLVTLQTTIRKF